MAANFGDSTGVKEVSNSSWNEWRANWSEWRDAVNKILSSEILGALVAEVRANNKRIEDIESRLMKIESFIAGKRETEE